MKISVIIPIYNVEKYLHRCIESVLAQTFTDFELILVDDGSLDDCGRICDEYAKIDNRIFTIHKENGGVSKARNIALDFATGEYICFCDSDDYIQKDYLETLYNALIETKSDCVSCNCTIIGDFSEKGKLTCKSQEYCIETSSKKEDFFKSCLSHEILIWAMWGRIFKKSIIDKNQIRVCETCADFAEDLGFFLMYHSHCDKIVHINYAGYYYYQRNDSMMAKTAREVKLNALNEVSYAYYNHINKYKSLSFIVQEYPVLHFWIMNNQYQRIIEAKSYGMVSAECKKIVRKKWYNKMISNFIFCCKEPIVLHGKNLTFDYKNFCFYTLHKNYKLFCILSGLYYKTKRNKKND